MGALVIGPGMLRHNEAQAAGLDAEVYRNVATGIAVNL